MNIITPPTKTVTIGNSAITVSPVRMRNLQAFANAVAPVMSEAIEAINGRAHWQTVIMLHTDALMLAATLSSDATMEQVQDALPDEFAELAVAVAQVNADFFAQRLIPRLTESVGSLSETVKQFGQTQPKP